MKKFALLMALTLLLLSTVMIAVGAEDKSQDILITFENHGANATGSSFGAPYRNRKHYSIAASARRDARAIADEYALTEIDHWPIRALSIYCFVYRVSADQDRSEILERLQRDERIESAQPLNEFNTSTRDVVTYNDEYAGMQHGLEALGLSRAHGFSRGQGVRIAVIDSNMDADHEDLVGRIDEVSVFAPDDKTTDRHHGTAVVSVIGALANNSKGIVGVAPEASIELLVSCWAEENAGNAVCDSFTLAKAMDQLYSDPPHILNLSLVGPHDPLLARLLEGLLAKDVIVIAADAAGDDLSTKFPASLDGVIGVKSSQGEADTSSMIPVAYRLDNAIYAPGHQIMVALPGDDYDFRSGSSLAAAHISGVVALLLAISPDQDFTSIVSLLQRSQGSAALHATSVDACLLLHLANGDQACPSAAPTSAAPNISSKLESGT